jgi:hypothetical protein
VILKRIVIFVIEIIDMIYRYALRIKIKYRLQIKFIIFAALILVQKNEKEWFYFDIDYQFIVTILFVCPAGQVDKGDCAKRKNRHGKNLWRNADEYVSRQSEGKRWC